MTDLGVRSHLITHNATIVVDRDLPETGRNDEITHQLHHTLIRRRFWENRRSYEARVWIAAVRRLIPLAVLIIAIQSVLDPGTGTATAEATADLLGVLPSTLRLRVSILNSRELTGDIVNILARLTWPHDYVHAPLECLYDTATTRWQRAWRLR